MTPSCYAGAMHYWRAEPATWERCLRAMHELGFTHVETPAPWRVHESSRGDFDWADERDLAGFIALARSVGLAVIVRPGPNVGAELTNFGIPDWVIAEPACRALTSRGTPAWFPAPPRAFPIPSAASGVYRARVRAWFGELARVVPHDVTLALDRATFFRDAAFDLDYHPDAIGWFGQGDVAPRAWDPSDVQRCIRWVRFREGYDARARRELADELRALGFTDVIETGAISYAARPFRDLRADTHAMIGIGGSAWLPPQAMADDDPQLDRDRVLAHLAAGARAIDVAMAVERERDYGAAIGRDGRVRASWIKPLLAALIEHDWPRLHRRASIAVIDVAADRRFGRATSLVDPLAPMVADLLGLGAANLATDPGALAMQRWQLAVVRALELAKLPYRIVDEHTPIDELATFAAVIAPTLDRVDRVLWQALRALADGKRAIVVIGPGTPTRDEFDQPLELAAPKRAGRLEPGSLDDLPGLAEALAGLAEPEAWQVERPTGVRSSVFVDAAGAAKLLIVQADARRPVTATLLADPAVAHLRDALTGERFAIRDGRVTLAISGARLLVVS